jgi:hypothetical protein
MLNWIWLALVVLAVAIGGWNNRLGEVTTGAFDGAKTAVTIGLGLIRDDVFCGSGLLRVGEHQTNPARYSGRFVRRPGRCCRLSDYLPGGVLIFTSPVA